MPDGLNTDISTSDSIEKREKTSRWVFSIRYKKLNWLPENHLRGFNKNETSYSGIWTMVKRKEKNIHKCTSALLGLCNMHRKTDVCMELNERESSA